MVCIFSLFGTSKDQKSVSTPLFLLTTECAVRDVLVCLRVAVLLGEAEVDAVDQVGLAAETDEEVVRLDVAVDERLVVDVLDPLEQQVRDHQDRLQVELPVAEVEGVLERRAQQV